MPRLIHARQVTRPRISDCRRLKERLAFFVPSDSSFKDDVRRQSRLCVCQCCKCRIFFKGQKKKKIDTRQVKDIHSLKAVLLLTRDLSVAAFSSAFLPKQGTQWWSFDLWRFLQGIIYLPEQVKKQEVSKHGVITPNPNNADRCGLYSRPHQSFQHSDIRIRRHHQPKSLAILYSPIPATPARASSSALPSSSSALTS